MVQTNPPRTRCSHCATRGVCLVGGLPCATREVLSHAIHETPFGKGRVLQQEGQVAQSIAIIKIGTVMASRHGEDGHPHSVALLGRGHTLGQYACYGQPEQIGATALSPGRVCTVEVADLYRLGVVDKKFHACLQSMNVRAHGQLADWSRVMRIKGVPQQLLAALVLFSREQKSRVVRLPSHVALAELLSTTRETIARSLSHLEAGHRIVRHDRWRCEVSARSGMPPDAGD